MKDVIYTELEPQTQIKSFVKSFWYFENNSNRMIDYSILPDGCFDLLFFSNENILLTGIWNKKTEISLPKNIKISAIRFKPLAVEYLLQFSIKKYLNASLPNPKIDFLEKSNITNFNNFVEKTTLKISSKLGTKKGIDPRKEKVFELLFKSKGTIKISELSEKSFWSSRQINRYFNSNFGISTKQYANILKVFSTYKDIANGILYPQTEYFDQSHYIKEVKKFTGTNPKELMKNKNDRFLQLSTQQTK